MDVRKKSIRDLSPDRAKVRMGTRQKTIKKVQLVYYLSRGGQLEHPHFMEVVLPYNQELRLRDVVGRLAALRGKEMPSLFSWSCKRRYKSGYVWNDLSEDDVILPVDGVEYVLKASELFEDCSEKNQDFISNVSATNATQGPVMGLHFQDRTVSSTKSESGTPKRKNESKAAIPQEATLSGHQELLPPKIKVSHKVCASRTRFITRNEDMGNIKTRSEATQYHLRAENKSPTSVITGNRRQMIFKPEFMDSTAHGDRRRRDKEEEEELSKESEGAENSTESPQSSTFTCSTRAQDEESQSKQSKKTVRPEEPNISQSSSIFSLLHFISCGSLAVESDNILNIKSLRSARFAEAKKRHLANSKNKSQSCNKVVDRTLGEELDSMLEDLRIINTQRAEKEYFSGSIVEIKTHGEAADPVLTRSASYDAERGSNAEMDAVIEKGNCGRVNMKNCIPRFKR